MIFIDLFVFRFTKRFVPFHSDCFGSWIQFQFNNKKILPNVKCRFTPLNKSGAKLKKISTKFPIRINWKTIQCVANQRSKIPKLTNDNYMAEKMKNNMDFYLIIFVGWRTTTPYSWTIPKKKIFVAATGGRPLYCSTR